MGGGAGAAPGSGRWIDGVPALLRWDTPSDVPERAQRELGRILRARFDALDLGWADTDEPELERVLSAPATSFRLLFAPTRPIETARFLRGALAGDGWSADGGRRVGPESRFHAPTVATGIPIDWQSPGARCLDVAGGPSSRPARWPELDDQEAALVVERVRGAYASVESLSSAAADLVARCTRVVAVRVNPVTPDRFGAGSEIGLLGQTLLLNAHGPGDLVPEIAEALVHEAIHSLLYVDELSGPWIAATGPGDDVLFDSPWSGRRIPLRVYLHACFVWAGLDAFWRRAAAADLFPAATVERHLLQTGCGFRSGPVLDVVAEHVAMVDPVVIAAIEATEAGVSAHV